MRRLLGLGVVLLMLLAAPVGQAALHDRNCMPPGENGGDAPAVLEDAVELGQDALDAECTGEMLLGVDADDWYRIDADRTFGATSLEVTVCPDDPKASAEPWETSIEVWEEYDPLSVVGVQIIHSDHLDQLLSPVSDLFSEPPTQIGASADAGCDTVLVEDDDFTGYRLYVGVHGDSGHGLYTLSVRLT